MEDEMQKEVNDRKQELIKWNELCVNEIKRKGKDAWYLNEAGLIFMELGW